MPSSLSGSCLAASHPLKFGSTNRIRQDHGGYDAAFKRMHTSWLRRALIDGLRQTAVRGIARAFASDTIGNGSARGISKNTIHTKVSRTTTGPRPDLQHTRSSALHKSRSEPNLPPICA